MGIRRNTCGIGGFVQMDNKQILEKAIQKAKDNGWKAETIQTADGTWMYGGEHNGMLFGTPIDTHVIFNHDFAKALWGEKETTQTMDYAQELWSANEDLSFEGERWQYHLQQMVLADNPIKYLKENT